MNNLVNEQLVEAIDKAAAVITSPDSPVLPTSLVRDDQLSEQLQADIWLASELHQVIGAYKIRGAYNFLRNLSAEQKATKVVTASAGNHGQGIALSANLMDIESYIFMPKSTPEQKIARVAFFGGQQARIRLVGQSFDETQEAAIDFAKARGAVFAAPFNDWQVIAGQGTWGREIVQQLDKIDLVMAPVGGMGLLAGISTAIKARSPRTEIVGVEPLRAASLSLAIDRGEPVPLSHVDSYIDGAAVAKVGNLPYQLAGHLVDQCLKVSNQTVRRVTTEFWEREDPMRVELAGALSVAGLHQLGQKVEGKRVVCLLSGGNLSADRYRREVRLGKELLSVGI